MKKVLLFLTAAAVFAALSLFAACGEEADVNAPEFSGVKERAEGQLFEPYDLLAGVTAQDDRDGDLSADVRAAVLPLEQIQDGKFTPKKTGEYRILYRVADKSGNVSFAQTFLTVTDNGDARLLFRAYDFSGIFPADTGIGCYDHAAAGAAGSARFEGGALLYSIEKFGAVDWYNKLTFAGLNLQPGKAYTFTWEAKSSVPLTFAMFVNINGGAWAPVCLAYIPLGQEYKQYSFDTTVISSAGEYAMFLQFGSEENVSLGGAEIAIRSVRIYEKTEA